jgi:hypothetical protein
VNLDIEEILCICGCSSRVHTKMNQKSWDRLNKQMEGYKEDTPEKREAFWTEFLTGDSQEEWACSECDCKSFKMDNLRYLEERLKEKKHG